ncbi:hypothetical protein AGLY_006788 [Aphis glycines]|uniref:Uncharacterized protein n=1 Tax=Aphis glycines TaxID=307491 RepID=A0A6G0TSK3_APHGL|nr:hypothetical protein AGLY_006788 [Aphis glycines]
MNIILNGMMNFKFLENMSKLRKCTTVQILENFTNYSPISHAHMHRFISTRHDDVHMRLGTKKKTWLQQVPYNIQTFYYIKACWKDNNLFYNGNVIAYEDNIVLHVLCSILAFSVYSALCNVLSNIFVRKNSTLSYQYSTKYTKMRTLHWFYTSLVYTQGRVAYLKWPRAALVLNPALSIRSLTCVSLLLRPNIYSQLSIQSQQKLFVRSLTFRWETYYLTEYTIGKSHNLDGKHYFLDFKYQSPRNHKKSRPEGLRAKWIRDSEIRISA